MVEKPVEECSVPVEKTNPMQKKKIAAKERGVNLNQISQQRKRQRRASSSGKKPVDSLCDQAKELITRFEKLMTDNAKYGDLAEAVTAAIKRPSESSGVESPKEEFFDTDILRIVEEGQSNHGCNLMPEGPQPGTSSDEFLGDNLAARFVDTLSFTYDHWQRA